MKKLSLYEFCEIEGKQELLREWDSKKNLELGLKPDTLPYTSYKKVWWICNKGHSWEATVGSRTKLGCGCPYCSGRRAITGYNDLATLKPELLEEWDYEKNAKKGIYPTEVSSGSGIKVWWKCKKGHSWESVISSRKAGCGCPYCRNLFVLSGYNDIATTHKDLLDEWDYDKNNEIGIYPSAIIYGGATKVWWKCSNENHSYFKTVYDKATEKNCPYCSRKKVLKDFNDLGTTHPELSVEWDNSKNTLKPEEVLAGSKQKIWWLCKKGHSYEATVAHRTNGSNCPYCVNQKILKGYNDLQTLMPEIAEDWDYDKNVKRPDEVSFGSPKRVWWKCKKGHEYEMTINHRTHGTNCPYCYGRYAVKGETDLTITNPELCKEWDYEKNILNPSDVTKYSNKKIWWICEKGHSWKTTVSNRSYGKGCPHCRNIGTSIAEQFLYFAIKQKFKNVTNREKISGYEYDITVEDIKLLIEYDGYYYHEILDDKSERTLQKIENAHNEDYCFLRVVEKEDAADIVMVDNEIMYKPKGKINDLVRIFELIIDYINASYSLHICKELPSDIEQKARENAAKERFENSLAVKRPDIAFEWNTKRNGKLSPTQFTVNSNEKVWWKCNNAHEWPAVIGSRTRYNLCCPKCLEMKNEIKKSVRIDKLVIKGAKKSSDLSVDEKFKLPTEFEKYYRLMKKGKISPMDIKREMQISNGILYKYIDRYEAMLQYKERFNTEI